MQEKLYRYFCQREVTNTVYHDGYLILEGYDNCYAPWWLGVGHNIRATGLGK